MNVRVIMKDFTQAVVLGVESIKVGYQGRYELQIGFDAEWGPVNREFDADAVIRLEVVA